MENKEESIFRVEITFNNETNYKIEELKFERIDGDYIFYFEKNGKYWRDTCKIDEIFLAGQCNGVGFTFDRNKVENIVHKILWEFYSKRKKDIQKIENDCSFLLTEIADKRKTVYSAISQLTATKLEGEKRKQKTF